MQRRTFLNSTLACLIAGTWRGLAPAAEMIFGGRPRDSRTPVTGSPSSGTELLDPIMLTFLAKIGCTAATLAIARKGMLTHSRGYGWSDRNGAVQAQPDTMIGIASCEKPITAAAIRQLARNGKLRLDGELFGLLRTEPRGSVTDARVRNITLRHLLEHKAGWQGEPLVRALNAAHGQGHKDPVPVETLLGYVMTQQLASAPGSRTEYCNFCYDTLRHVLTKVSGMSAVEYFRRELFRPHGIAELRGFEAPNAPPRRGDPPLAWNDGGPVSASAPALCTFMRHYWLNGEPRERGNPQWQMNGSLPGSTAMMLWRPDGTDIAVLFNGRGSPSHEEIKQELLAVLPGVA